MLESYFPNIYKNFTGENARFFLIKKKKRSRHYQLAFAAQVLTK